MTKFGLGSHLNGSLANLCKDNPDGQLVAGEVTAALARAVLGKSPQFFPTKESEAADKARREAILDVAGSLGLREALVEVIRTPHPDSSEGRKLTEVYGPDAEDDETHLRAAVMTGLAVAAVDNDDLTLHYDGWPIQISSSRSTINAAIDAAEIIAE